MGLLVHTTFETSQGIPVTNIYLRICSITTEFVNKRAYVTIKCESHINREKRLEGKHALYVPNIPTYFNTDTPLDAGWNNISYLYNFVKTQLEGIGFEVIEDVFEPEPEPAPEPTPEETSTSQQSSE
jgi:hypothetical protein